MTILRVHQHRLAVDLRIAIIRLIRDLVDRHVFRNARADHDLSVQIDGIHRVRRDIGGHFGRGLLGCGSTGRAADGKTGHRPDRAADQRTHRRAAQTAHGGVLPGGRVLDGGLDDGHADRLAVGIKRHDLVARLDVQIVAIGPAFQTVAADLAPVRAVDAAQDRHLVPRADGADHAMLDARAGPDVQIRGNGGHRLRRGGPCNRQGRNEGRNKIRFHGNLLSLGHAAR